VKADTFDVTATGVIFTALPDQVQVDVLEIGVYIVTSATTFESIVADASALSIDVEAGTWTLTLNDVPKSGGLAYYIDTYVQVTVEGNEGPVQNIYKEFSLA
jgi:hypothetical protein